MEISINNKPADITIENEKNIGDVLVGFENWLKGSGSRVSGLYIDGSEIPIAGLPSAMERELSAIDKLDIRISSWDELAVEALGELTNVCNAYNNSSFEEREGIRKNWEESAAAAFMFEEIKDIFNYTDLAFSGDSLTFSDLLQLIDERIRELGEPQTELEKMEKPVMEIALRMEELPLDMQTGKDKRVTQTMQLFSQMGEKLFRLFRILRQPKDPSQPFAIDGQEAKQFLDDFNAVLGELNSAYKNQDLILIGDLAEYEMAPRLLKLFTALKDLCAAEAKEWQ